MRIRPKQGQVLVELLPPRKSFKSLHLPETRRLKDEIGRQEAREGIVRELGIWPTNSKGYLIPYEFKRGDTVLVDAVLGREFRLYPITMRMYDCREILAVMGSKQA